MKHSLRERSDERSVISNHVVGRHHDEHGIRAVRHIGLRGKRGERQRGRCITRRRFKQEARPTVAPLEPFDGSEAQFGAAYDNGRRPLETRCGVRVGVPRKQPVQPMHCRFEQRLVTEQADQLFRTLLARQRP